MSLSILFSSSTVHYYQTIKCSHSYVSASSCLIHPFVNCYVCVELTWAICLLRERRFLPIDFAGRVETVSLLLLHNVLNMSKLNWKNPIVAVPGVDTRGLLSMISEGIEPSTFSVLTKCDNRYTMKPCETHGRPWVAAKAAGHRYVTHVTYSLTYRHIWPEHNMSIHQYYTPVI